MPELRISINEVMEKKLDKISKNLGVKPTEYVKSLIIQKLEERSDKDE